MTLTPEERKHMVELCEQMQTEQDGRKLTALAEELNLLLTPVLPKPTTPQPE